MSRQPARARLFGAVIAGVCYVAAIAVANWMLTHVGTPTDGGNYLLPVGFGLMAPSGVYAAAVVLTARDVVQRCVGRAAGFAAVVLGAAVSWFIASPSVAIASGLTFLISETIDFAVFTSLWRRGLVLAVVVSGMAGLIVDSCVFLSLVGIPWSVALAGQILGKTWIVLASAPIVYGLRQIPALKFNSQT